MKFGPYDFVQISPACATATRKRFKFTAKIDLTIGYCQSVGTFGDMNVECQRPTYDVNLTWFKSADWTSTSKQRQSDVIRTAFTFYVRVTKGP